MYNYNLLFKVGLIIAGVDLSSILGGQTKILGEAKGGKK